MNRVQIFSRSILLGVLAFFIFTVPAMAYTPWVDNTTYDETLGEARVLYRQRLQTIPVYPITQKNCIFEEMEDKPDTRTSTDYRQPHCASLRNQRVSASENSDMPVGTKLTRVPANEFFKINMVVSDQMSNRAEEFGIQIIDAETKRTQYLQGGWKPGDQKLTRAIKLKPGRYFWRCPVNPTPWYGLIAD